MKQDIELLKTPISQLPLSGNFYLRSKLMGFHHLQDIIDTPPAGLLGKEDFSYQRLGELSRLLADADLLHLLQPVMGNSFS